MLGLKLNHVSKRSWLTDAYYWDYETRTPLLTWINFNPSMDKNKYNH